MDVDRISVLLVEDNPADARLLREAVREVEGSHIHLSHVDTLAKALSRLDSERFDVVMLDLSLPDAEGLETLVRTHSRAPSVPIVVLTGLDDEGLAISAVRKGAQDYLVKGQVTSHLLVRAMRYATERKRAIEALERSEEYFRSLIENALDIITVLDPDGKVRYASPSFERSLGYPQGALNGVNAFDLIHPADREGAKEMLATGTEHPGASQHVEFRIRHRNGTWRVFEAIGKRFEQESSVNGYVLNSRDVTERKRADEQLRQANETLRAVIEASPLAIYALDLDANVLSWNSAAERMFGYSAPEVIDSPLPIVYSEEGEHAFRKRLEDARDGHLAAGVEQQARRRNGQMVEVSIWNALLRDASGAVTGIVEAVADNSERKRLEEQFRQVQKMEAVGRLAGGVAHDFNNLLTVITGYCQMIADYLGPEHFAAEDLQQVLKAADRAATLTRQLLAFSRRQMVQPKVFDLNALVKDLHPMVKRLVGENVEIRIVAAASHSHVRVDPGHLEQVLVNLAVNARDAMPKGGVLTIATDNKRIMEESLSLPEGDYVVMSVTDTGVGMTPETLMHLFEPFFTTKEKGRGTGLGLSTSYGIIKQNRGDILVRSSPGAGSTFTIYLPLVTEPVDAEDQTRKNAAQGGAETILIAEDEEGVRTVMIDMLRKQGYTVLAAASGPEALEIAAQGSRLPDLLITDVVMPKMSGRELAERLRESAPLRVLFVSGYTEGAIANEAELAPGMGFLHKPFSPEELARKVRDVLEAPDGAAGHP